MKRLTHIAMAALLVSFSVAACDDDPLIDVDNQAPTADAGADQTVVDNDGDGSEQVSLDGSGSSDADGTIASYVWTEGGTSIATGVSPNATFTVGTHDVTLTVTDDRGATDSDGVTIIVDPQPAQNTDPVATITAPADAAEFDEGADVSLEGTGEDTEDGSLTGTSLAWSSDVDGDLGTGSPLVVNTLTPGPHAITLTATDSEGATGTATVNITINALPATFAADIQPYFVDNGCTGCHGETNQFGGFRLDSYAAISTGENNDSEPLIVAGDATQGILIPMIQTGHQGAPHGTDIEADLVSWINAGALDN